jgi:hypothetical protein
MMTKTYDPSKVLFTLGGVLITGYADGTFLKVSRDEDSFTKQVGSGGEVARSANKNKSGSIALTLMQSSPSNDYLSGLVTVDELAGTGVVTAQVKDANGTSLHLAPEAWVKKPTDSEYAKETGSREWLIDCAQLVPFAGGVL